ncbi:MAG TPA: OsmC family protein [Blastocatellia bacterium]|nr:OsmC family protein [Blastocatellia bacterium]
MNLENGSKDMEPMNAIVTMVDGLQLVGSSDSGHAVVMDTSTKGGGHASGASPMELVLLAAGGCSAMDVISILKKKRLDLRGLEIKLSGQRAETEPKVFTRVVMHYVFRGRGLTEDPCRKSIELSHEKYCSVLGMVNKTATVEYDIEIINEE